MVAAQVVVVILVMNAHVEVVLVQVIFLDLLEKVISQFLSSQGDAQLTRTQDYCLHTQIQPRRDPKCVITVSCLMLSSHFMHRVMSLCYKQNTIPTHTFGEMPLDIGKRLGGRAFSGTLHMHVYDQSYCRKSSTHCIGAEKVFLA